MQATLEHRFTHPISVYLCPICQKPSTRRSDLKRHIQHVHKRPEAEARWLILRLQPTKGWEESVWRYPTEETRYAEALKTQPTT